MMNSARQKVGFSCNDYFRSIVVLVFAPATALNKFRFRFLGNKIINLVPVMNT